MTNFTITIAFFIGILSSNFFNLNDRIIEDDQTIIYEKYSDYENNTGEVYDDWGLMNGLKITVRKGNSKTKYAGNDIWGFKYKGMLFRPIEYRKCFAAVVNQGQKLIYYEQGLTHFQMLTKGKSGHIYDDCDPLYFVSADLKSKIYFSDCHTKNQSSYKRFMKSNPTRKRLETCFSNIFSEGKMVAGREFKEKLKACFDSYFENEDEWIKEDANKED